VIKFSHGGHFFAVSEQNDVRVFRFFTGESTPSLTFSWHKAQIIDIEWLPNDLGLVSSAYDNTV
jgi:WD40 repeat protein